jgi:hypothetical protein
MKESSAPDQCELSPNKNATPSFGAASYDTSFKHVPRQCSPGRSYHLLLLRFVVMIDKEAIYKRSDKRQGDGYSYGNRWVIKFNHVCSPGILVTEQVSSYLRHLFQFNKLMIVIVPWLPSGRGQALND